MDEKDAFVPVSWNECILHEKVEAIRWLTSQLKQDLFAQDDVHVRDSDQVVMTVGHVPLLSRRLSLCGHARRSRQSLYEQLLKVLTHEYVRDAVMRMTFAVHAGEVPSKGCLVYALGSDPMFLISTFRAAQMWMRLQHVIKMRVRFAIERRRSAKATAKARWKWVKKNLTLLIRVEMNLRTGSHMESHRAQDRLSMQREASLLIDLQSSLKALSKSLHKSPPTDFGFLFEKDSDGKEDNRIYLSLLTKHRTVIVFWASWDSESITFLRNVVYTTHKSLSLLQRIKDALNKYPNIGRRRRTEYDDFFTPAESKPKSISPDSDEILESMLHQEWENFANLNKQGTRTAPPPNFQSTKDIRVVLVCLDTDISAAYLALEELRRQYEDEFYAAHEKYVQERELEAAIDAYRRAPPPEVLSRLQREKIKVADIATMASTEVRRTDIMPPIPPVNVMHVWGGRDGVAAATPTEFGVQRLPHIALMSSHRVVLNSSIPPCDGLDPSSSPRACTIPQGTTTTCEAKPWHEFPEHVRNRIKELFLHDPSKTAKSFPTAPLSFQCCIEQKFTRSNYATYTLDNGVMTSSVQVTGVCFVSQYRPYAETIALLRIYCSNFREDFHLLSDAVPMPPPWKYIPPCRGTLLSSRPRVEKEGDSVLCTHCHREIVAVFECYFISVTSPNYECVLCHDCETRSATLYDQCHIFCKIRPGWKWADVENVLWGLGNVKPLPLIEKHGRATFWPHPSNWHVGVYCSVCGSRVEGTRWHCLHEFSFDMCERCETSWMKDPSLHPKKHIFLKIPFPLAEDDSVLQPTIVTM